MHARPPVASDHERPEKIVVPLKPWPKRLNHLLQATYFVRYEPHRIGQGLRVTMNRFLICAILTAALMVVAPAVYGALI